MSIWIQVHRLDNIFNGGRYDLWFLDLQFQAVGGLVDGAELDLYAVQLLLQYNSSLKYAMLKGTTLI